jgi:hypothetical protein
MTKRFQDAMRLMRAADPQRKENGFQLLRGHVTEHTDELIAIYPGRRLICMCNYSPACQL